MPASVDPRRSFPAVVVRRSLRVEPGSLVWVVGGEDLQFTPSLPSCSSLICFPTGHSLFSAKTIENKLEVVMYHKWERTARPWSLKRNSNRAYSWIWIMISSLCKPWFELSICVPLCSLTFSKSDISGDREQLKSDTCYPNWSHILSANFWKCADLYLKMIRSMLVASQ